MPVPSPSPDVDRRSREEFLADAYQHLREARAVDDRLAEELAQADINHILDHWRDNP